jgi:predicted PurR-regulated permease PerM
MSDPTRDPALDLRRGPAGDPHANATDPDHRGELPPRDVGRGEVRHNRTVGWRSRDIVRTAGLVLAMYLFLRLIWFANALFLTVFLGILFAIAISAGVDRLQQWRIPRGIGAALIVLTFFGLLFGFGAWMAPTLREQGAELRLKLPEAVDRMEEWVNRRQSGLFGVLLGGTEAVRPAAKPASAGAGAPSGAAQVAAPGTPPAAGAPAPTTAGATADSGHAAPSLKGRITSQFGGASKYLFPFLTHTVAAVGGFLLIVFLSIYFAADPELYRRGVLALLPARRRVQGSEVMDRIAMVLRKWLVTQLIAMAVIGTVTTVALLILQVKAAFALGLLAGLFEFIPTVGPLLSAVPAIGMGFLDSPEKALLVGGVYVAIQFLENHILIPLLMKGGMDLPPALTVITQALLALVFGFLGLMVAVPLLATVLVIVQVLYVQKGPAGGPAPRAGRSPDLDEVLEGRLGAAR